MFELSGIYSFDSRINFFDSLLSKITENTEYKFYILSVTHYLFALIVFGMAFFSINIYILFIAIFFIIAAIFFNYADNGCQLTKLERKYIGKNWFGPLTVLYVLFPNLITIEIIKYISYTPFLFLMCLTLFYAIYKVYKIIKNYYLEKHTEKHTEKLD